MKAALVLRRIIKMPEFTMGELFINGKKFCNTLEDQVRDANNDGDLNDPGEEKVYGKTAIPRGTYKVIVNLSNRFKKELPLLLNVPGFEGIRIHGGNKAEDSLGCILVAYNAYEKEGRIQGSSSNDLVTELKKYTQIELTII